MIRPVTLLFFALLTGLVFAASFSRMENCSGQKGRWVDEISEKHEKRIYANARHGKSLSLRPKSKSSAKSNQRGSKTDRYYYG